MEHRFYTNRGTKWISKIESCYDQESLTGWIMGWSGACTFPIVKPVLDDANARKAIKAMIANQKG